MNFSNLTREEKLKLYAEKIQERNKSEKERCRNDKFYWLANYVKTLDQHDKENPIKPFPDKKHLKNIIKVYERESLLLVEKSRQMMMSWLFCALCLHEAMFNPGRYVFIQSKKEDDANSLLDRVKFMYEHLPEWMKPEENPKDTYCKLQFKYNNSIIRGIPEGGDQIRSHTASLIFSDEMAFQPEAEDAYTASLPCVKGGGKFVGVSTANPSFFYELTAEKAEKHQIATGIWVKHTPKGNCVLTLHYMADPDRRTKEWKEQEMLGFKTEEGGTDARWKKEYEIDYEATGGTKVYPELEDDYADIYIEPFKIPKWWNRYGSIDPGTRNPTSVHFYAIDEHGRIFVYWELYEKELHYLQLCRTLENHSDFKQINKNGLMIDPAAAQRVSQTQLGIKSFKEILQGEGLTVFSGNRDRSMGAERIRELIHEGKLYIFNTCPKMWEELNKLRYEEWKGSGNYERNIKENIVAKDDHAWSDLRYFVLSTYANSKKPLTGIEKKIKELNKKRSSDFDKLYSV